MTVESTDGGFEDGILARAGAIVVLGVLRRFSGGQR